MKGWIVQFSLILAGFCFSFGISPAIAQAETEATDTHSASATNDNSIASNANNERSLQSEATLPATIKKNLFLKKKY